MQIWQITFLSFLLSACTTREIRCDSKLSAINPPASKAVSQRSTSGTKP
jgi:hypothetical protein